MMHYLTRRYEFGGDVGYQDFDLITAPDVVELDENTRPANIEETAVAWFKKREICSGQFLAVSQQPFINPEAYAIARVVPPGIQILGVGAAAENVPLRTFLSCLARGFDEEVSASQKIVAV